MAQGRSKLVGLDPSFRAWVEWFIREIESFGLPITITSGYRAPGTRVQGAVARPARTSRHGQGVAVDLGVTGYRARDVPAEVWAEMGAMWKAQGRGFRWGGDFRGNYDPVHFDWS